MIVQFKVLLNQIKKLQNELKILGLKFNFSFTDYIC